MAKGTARGSRKTATLDYSYGEERPQPSEELPVPTDEDSATGEDNDELIVGSRKHMAAKKAKDEELQERVRARQARREKSQKYLGYSDFLNSNECDSNGYRFDENDDFGRLDEAGWNRIIGFVLIRIVAPLLLVVQGIVVGLVLWRVYEFDFSPTGVLASQNCLPWIAGALSMNAFLVHGISKQLFRRNYYKLRNTSGRSSGR